MFRMLCEGDVFSTSDADKYIAGSRTALLPDGKYICTFHMESAPGANDFIPMKSYSEDGIHWGEATPVWPSLIGKKSIFCSVRNTRDGRISICGACYNIDKEGEYWWSDELCAMKENCIAFSISDNGYDFPEPTYVPLPFYAGAENAGGMMVDADGTLTVVYAPYPTIEAKEKADTCCLVMMVSRDGGKTFESKKIANVPEPSIYAETWIDRLSDGKLMVSTWQTASTETPDLYLLSDDDGKTFRGPFPSPFKGQSTSLTPWKHGKALIVYNQRKETPAGVRIAVAAPVGDDFNRLEDHLVWEAKTVTRSDGDADFGQWTDFSFGEPHVLVMKDGKLLVTLWYEQNGHKGVRYVILEHE